MKSFSIWLKMTSKSGEWQIILKTLTRRMRSNKYKIIKGKQHYYSTVVTKLISLFTEQQIPSGH